MRSGFGQGRQDGVSSELLSVLRGGGEEMEMGGRKKRWEGERREGRGDGYGKGEYEANINIIDDERLHATNPPDPRGLRHATRSTQHASGLLVTRRELGTRIQSRGDTGAYGDSVWSTEGHGV